MRNNQMIFIANSTASYVLVAVIAAAAFAVLAVTALWAVRLLRMQHTLKYSITLVSLRINKVPYLALDFFFVILMFIVFNEIINPNPLIVQQFEKIGGTENFTKIIAASIFALVICGGLICALLTFTKSAIVDRGVFTGTDFLDWYHLYDYLVDEKHNFVILSNSVQGALTLAGTSVPLRFNKNDIDKLKFILNKNKNKFIPLQELR